MIELTLIPTRDGDPVQIALAGDFVEMEAAHSLLVKKHLYLRFDGETPLFNTDTEHWSTFTEMVTGTVGVSFGTTDEGPFVRLLAESYRR